MSRCSLPCAVWVFLGTMMLLCPSLAQAQDNLIVNPGFEEGSPQTFPSDHGYWGGDPSAFVAEQQNITPPEGSRMLQFIWTGPVPHVNTVAAEVWQSIDVRDYLDLIQTGNAVGTLTAAFNRIPGDDQTDTLFSVWIMTFAGVPSSFLSQVNAQSWLADAHGQLYSDGEVQTWQQATTDLVLPPETDFIGIRVAAHENVFNDGSDPEFDGHYCDAAILTIVGATPTDETTWGAIKAVYE